MGADDFLLDQPTVTDLQMVCVLLDATLNDLVAAFAPLAAMFFPPAADDRITTKNNIMLFLFKKRF